jgi:hypothetical protein
MIIIKIILNPLTALNSSNRSCGYAQLVDGYSYKSLDLSNKAYNYLYFLVSRSSKENKYLIDSFALSVVPIYSLSKRLPGAFQTWL